MKGLTVPQCYNVRGLYTGWNFAYFCFKVKKPSMSCFVCRGHGLFILQMEHCLFWIHLARTATFLLPSLCQGAQGVGCPMRASKGDPVHSPKEMSYGVLKQEGEIRNCEGMNQTSSLSTHPIRMKKRWSCRKVMACIWGMTPGQEVWSPFRTQDWRTGSCDITGTFERHLCPRLRWKGTPSPWQQADRWLGWWVGSFRRTNQASAPQKIKLFSKGCFSYSQVAMAVPLCALHSCPSMTHGSDHVSFLISRPNPLSETKTSHVRIPNPQTDYLIQWLISFSSSNTCFLFLSSP